MKALSLAFVFLMGAMVPGSLSEVSSSEEVVVTVDSTNLRFSPSTITITEGDSVRFFWSGELLAHNAVADDGLFDSGDAARNVDYSFTFDVGTNGTHQYVCEPHEEFGMVGTIIVEPAPQDSTPEPGPPEPEDPTASGEQWIPFFGLEVVLSVLLVVAIYQFGRTQGLGEVSLVGSGSEESEGAIAEDGVEL